MAPVGRPDPAATTRHGAPARQTVAGARRAALFASGLQRSDAPTAVMAAEAITATVRRFGIHGCVGRMAQEFGDHPDAAAERMRWICQFTAKLPARPQMPADAGGAGTKAGNDRPSRTNRFTGTSGSALAERITRTRRMIMNLAISRGRGHSRRARLRRALAPAVVIGGVVLAAGCHSGDPHHMPVDGGGKTPYERAEAIAQCMRRSGVPSYPDPGSNGAFPASANANKSPASFQAAVRACQGLPSSGVGNAPF